MMLRSVALPVGCLLVLIGFVLIAMPSLLTGLLGGAEGAHVIAWGGLTLIIGFMFMLMDQRP